MKSRIIVVALIEKDGKILLGKKADGKGPYPNTWHTPGGGVDLLSETLEDALKREAIEETGLETEKIERLGFDEDYEPDKNNEMTHYVFLTYKVVPKSAQVKAGDDLKKLQWFRKSELNEIPLTRPSIKLFKKLSWI